MSVYFITCRDLGVVKIGYAENPYSRLNNIRVACPVEVELELILEGSFAEEKALHRLLKEYRVRGEWFLITPAIESLIANPPSLCVPSSLDTVDPHERLERIETEDWISGRRMVERVGNWQRMTRERIMARKLAATAKQRLASPNSPPLES